MNRALKDRNSKTGERSRSNNMDAAVAPGKANFDIPDLRSRVRGRVITPQDPEYNQARTVFYGGFDARPAVIVRAADAADIAHVVSLTRESGLELAVRSGGHSAVGHGVSDGGILLDLRDMRRLDIDVEKGTAWAETGLTAGEYTIAASAHGLATGFGDTASVGIGGITLGGGVGYLVRKHGMTIDHLLAAEMVLADGEFVHVDAESHPDLFWAIRGGGGNFGVATRFKFRLHPVDRILGGMLILPATPGVIAGFVDAAEAAPDELSTILNVMPAPPMPFVPAEQHGQLIALAFMAWSGPVDAGAAALAPFRSLAAPIVDMVRPVRYVEMFQPDDADYHPTAVGHTMFLDRIDLGAAESIVERLRTSDAAMRVAQLRVLGGAMGRVPVEATAFAHRGSRIMANLAAFYNGANDRAVRAAWLDEFAAALDQGDPGAYVNFLGDSGEAEVRAAYPGRTWDRLAAVKAQYDPTNLFRRNHNIAPAA